MKTTFSQLILAAAAAVIYSLIASNVVSAPTVTGQETSAGLAYFSVVGVVVGGADRLFPEMRIQLLGSPRRR
jgi:hypothetical protein